MKEKAFRKIAHKLIASPYTDESAKMDALIALLVLDIFLDIKNISDRVVVFEDKSNLYQHLSRIRPFLADFKFRHEETRL